MVAGGLVRRAYPTAAAKNVRDNANSIQASGTDAPASLVARTIPSATYSNIINVAHW